MHCKTDEIAADGENANHDPVSHARSHTVDANLSDIQTGKGERDYELAENEYREHRLSPPERRRFHVRALHQHAVPKEFKDEDDNERRNECQKTSFVVHTTFSI